MNRKFGFNQFLEENNITINELPGQLQKRLLGLESLIEQLPNVINEDREELESRIDRLAMEIEEDLFEEYEHLLLNNEIDESNPSDEEIINKLYHKGWREITRDELLKVGYKGDLRKSQNIGQFKLLKRTFFYKFDIVPLKNVA